MNWTRVFGMIRRNFYVWIRDLDRLFDAFWWAFFDLVIWGLMSTYFTQGVSHSNLVQQILIGIILWSVLARSQWEMSSSMLLESWEKNLINIFASPLTVGEFIVSSILLGVGKLLLVFFFMSGVAFLFYHFNIFAMSWWIVPLLVNVFLTSIWIALVVNALILRFGKRVMSFAWTLVVVVNPLSGVMYPIAALPKALQIISYAVPTSYVFEGMRSLLTTGSMDVTYIWMSMLLNGVYTALSVLLYVSTFQKARANGWLIKLA